MISITIRSSRSSSTGTYFIAALPWCQSGLAPLPGPSTRDSGEPWRLAHAIPYRQEAVIIDPDGLSTYATYAERLQLDAQDAGASPIAGAVRTALQQVDLSTLSREQLDRLGNPASALMGVVSTEGLRHDGWTLKPGWFPSETSPSGEMVTV